MATIFIPALMRDLTGGRDRIELPGRTVGELIEELERRYPGARDRLCDETGLASHIMVAIDGEEEIAGLAARVAPDSEVHFIPSIAGG